MKNGRPLKFKTPEDLLRQGMDYVADCQEQDRPMTITGLALHLDTTRETLMDYQGRDGFSDAVKRLKLYCENFAEERLYTAKNAAGPIFALKNFGWRDNHTFTDPDGNAVAPTTINLVTATQDELLRFLTAKGADNARSRKGHGKAGLRA